MQGRKIKTPRFQFAAYVGDADRRTHCKFRVLALQLLLRFGVCAPRLHKALEGITWSAGVKTLRFRKVLEVWMRLRLQLLDSCALLLCLLFKLRVSASMWAREGWVGRGG